MHRSPFASIYRHGFVRVAVCIPPVSLSDPEENAARTLAMAREAEAAHAAVVVFPELGLTGYSNDDLFQQEALLQAAVGALARVVAGSAACNALWLVGVPLRVDQRLFNCAVALRGGRILGVTPKTYLPNYREFYERRQFTPGGQARSTEISLLGATVPFGNDLVYDFASIPDCTVHVELCEDLWVPVPPSTAAALAGATVLANLSASNVTIGKADYRRLLCTAQSGRCLAAYAYAGAGQGESTTDLAWDGHGLICENGQLLGETARFATGARMLLSDVDVSRLAQERMRMTTFADAAAALTGPGAHVRRIAVPFEVPAHPVPLRRRVERFPYVPSDPTLRDERCHEAYDIQVQGLATRLSASGIRKVVIGVSGGLDSAHALIVAVRAMERLGLPRAHVLAYSMPGFATSLRTREAALGLMRALGVDGREIDIRPSCQQMLTDLGHPAARGEAVHDITFENVQAGERTSHLFRLANLHGALVVGTSDLSELALGWCTYGVGDHMSHYGVNASVPKTLVKHLIRWVIRTRQFDEAVCTVLQSIVDTAFSPELVPGEAGATGPSQETETVLGPYALHDFFLYYVSRFGYGPGRVAFLAEHAWQDPATGDWPEEVPAAERIGYDRTAIRHWLQGFLTRFFGSSQFKRSAMPNGPKVGSGGSLSPRGDWRAPSDGRADVWLDALRREVPAGEE